MQDQLAVPSLAWVYLFVLVGFAMFVGALYHAIKVGIYEYQESCSRPDPRLAQLCAAGTQVTLLVLFGVAYWVLESAAQAFTPYFVYSPEFPDGVRLWSMADSKVFPVGSCPYNVKTQLLGDSAYKAIPLSVLMMESSLTYAAMWTALMLQKRGVPRYVLVPLWASLFVVILDLLLDPVVAATYDCRGVRQDGIGSGIGLWHWFLPTGRDPYLGHWFGVPLFNYAAWWTAPVILISLAMAWKYWRGRAWPKYRARLLPRARPLPILDTAPESPLFALTAVVLIAAYALVQVAPGNTPLSVCLQWNVLVVALLGTGAFVVWRVRSFETGGEPDPNLTLPPLLFLGVPVLALLIEGFFLNIAGLIVVGLVSAVLVVVFTLWPYGQTICRLGQRLIDLDRFIRLAYYGYSAVLVLLGAFSVAVELQASGLPRFDLSNWQIGGLLVVALAFHVFAYVSNDVIDLDIDVDQPRRKNDPLVRYIKQGGTTGISPQKAWAIALVQPPVALLAAYLLDAGLLAYAVLVGGFALMSVYNVFGKWCEEPAGLRRRLFRNKHKHAPPITDAVQALAWGSLVLFGALVRDPDRASDNWLLVWTVFAFGAGFILLINGIHGGLRDLANDTAKGCWTTARWLGAELDASGAAVSNGSIRAFAYVVEAAMFFVMPGWVLATAIAPTDQPSPGLIELGAVYRWSVGAILVAFFLLSHRLLRRVVRDREPDRDNYTSVQPLVLMHAPWVSFAPFILGFNPFWILVVCFYGPLLSNANVLRAITSFTHPQISNNIDDPP